MAGNIIDSLLVKIGLDSEQLKDGLDQAAQGIDNFARGAERSGEAVDRLAAHATKSGLLLGNVSDDVAERILEIGSSGQKAALAAGRAMDSLGKQVGAIGEKIMALGAPLLAAFGGTALFQSFVQDGNALAILSDRLGVSAQKIDAWAKANEDAGGSQEAFKGALENFILTTGRGEKAFFEMGDHIKGLSQRQAEYFLQSQGLSADAAAVFLKYRDNAEEAAKAFEGVAFTDEKVKLAREFNRQWRNFTNQASSLGGVLLTAVMPPLTAVMKTISSGVGYLAEHSRFVKIAAGAIAAIFGGAYLRNIVAAVKASSLFVNVFVKGMPVIKAFNAALLANPLGVLIAAAVAACAIIDDFEGFLEGDVTALETFMQWCGLTSEEVDNIRQNILSFCRAVWNIPNNIKLALGEAWDVIKEMGAWFADLFHLPDAKAFTDFFAKVGDVAGSIGSTLWGGIVEGFRFIDYIADALGGLPDAFVKGFDNGISYIYEKFLAWLVEPLRSLLPESPEACCRQGGVRHLRRVDVPDPSDQEGLRGAFRELRRLCRQGKGDPRKGRQFLRLRRRGEGTRDRSARGRGDDQGRSHGQADGRIPRRPHRQGGRVDVFPACVTDSCCGRCAGRDCGIERGRFERGQHRHEGDGADHGQRLGRRRGNRRSRCGQCP